MDNLIAQLMADGRMSAFIGATSVLILMGSAAAAVLTTPRLRGSSVFNRLFIVVAVVSSFFSGVSSAIGFGLITSQESSDFFRNSVLPPAFGVFVFFLALAIWVGGAELVRHRDWFRGLGKGAVGDAAFFLERCLKLFVVIPVLAIILFFVSTWTTVVGIGGVDAVRHTYSFEIARLQAECSGITSYRQRDFLFREELILSVRAAEQAARAELERGAQTGSSGRGAVSDYISGIAIWLRSLEESVGGIIDGDDPSGDSPYQSTICARKVDELKQLLATNAYLNYDKWAREFETEFDNFVSVLNIWRHDLRIERLLEQQIAGFDRANPLPYRAPGNEIARAQEESIKRYSASVIGALETLLRKEKLAKPPVPKKSAAELSPERGMDIFRTWFEPQEESVEEERVSRRADVVAEEFIPGISTITPRDAVLKNAAIFSDIWALGIAWDYAAYILMLAYLFFPSAERAARFKDED